MVEIDLDLTDAWGEDRGWQQLAERAVVQAFAVAGFAPQVPVSLSISLSNNDEVQALNAQWRDKDKPTNVLSFPMLEGAELTRLSGPHILLGDIILAHGVCTSEAEKKGISLADHATHLIIHGSLHLLGHDHIGDAEAEAMEALEVKALASLGLANPY